MKTLILKSGTAVVVLLFAAVSVHAQENKRKEHESKPANHPPPASNSHPSNPPVQHTAPSQPAVQPHTPQAPSQPAQVSHPAAPPPQVSRPVYQPHTPQGAERPSPQPQQPLRTDHPGGFQPNQQGHPAQTDRPGAYQPNQQGHSAPSGHPGTYQPNQPGQPSHVGPGQPVQRGGFGGGNHPEVRPQGPPARVVQTRGGDTIRRDASGRVSEVRMRSGTVVYHPPSGVRRVEVVRPGGHVVVAGPPGHGYVQRQVIIHNQTIVKRTYVVGGVSYARVYRPVVYGGVAFNVYTPVRYYRPAFYAYAYNPWERPVVYNWGWGGSPWYGYYGGYFTPYPVYSSPALWLTDYLISATLQEAYQERMAAQQANYYSSGGQVAMTPAVKQVIADEVHRQLEQERIEGQQMNANASSIFADNASHVFVADTSLLVNSNAGECTLSEGDVLQMNGAPPLNATTASVIVLASRGPDCRRGAMAEVQLQDLQEMQNRMRETIDQGLGKLQEHQGQGGLPALPSGAAGTVDSPYVAEAQPDPNVNGELTAASQEADGAEQAAVSQSQEAGAGEGASGPATLSLGQTIDEVRAIQGEPLKIVDLGSKKIYVYKDIKVTFTDGRLTDVQ